MKKFSIFAAVLVLTLTVFTGCRRKNNAMTNPTQAAPMPTVATTEATTTPSTEAPTDMTTMPGATGDLPDGMDPDNNTAGTEAGTEGRSETRSGMTK